MPNPIKRVFVCILSLMLLLPLLAADLKTYKDVYQKNSEEIRQKYKPQFDDLQQKYQKALETLKSSAKSKGDFKTIKAVIDEIERFQKTKFLPPAQDENEIPEIKTFQATYVKMYSRLETDMTAKMGTLTAKYDQVLDRLQKELVQAEKVTEAMEVQQEREKAQAMLKGYAAQMSELTGSAATNATVAAASGTPLLSAEKSEAKKDLYPASDPARETQAGELKGAQSVNAETGSVFGAIGTVKSVSAQGSGIPGTMQRLKGAWKIVRESPEGTSAKGFVYFFIDNHEPWDGWKFDSKLKLWRVDFRRDLWAKDMFVFNSMEGSALRGEIYPEKKPVLMVPLDLANFQLPKSVALFDGFWSYAFSGHNEIVVEFKNGKSLDGIYSLRLNKNKKTLDLSEQGVKEPVQFLPVENDVWMGMGGSSIPKTLRRK